MPSRVPVLVQTTGGLVNRPKHDRDVVVARLVRLARNESADFVRFTTVVASFYISPHLSIPLHVFPFFSQESPAETAVERTWHLYDSPGHSMALDFM